MRLRPGEPFGLMRAARADDVVPLATPVRLRDGRMVDAIPMRKGDIITMPSVRAPPVLPTRHADAPKRNMDPALWGADARDCRPERWEQLSAEAERQLGWSHLTTFGQGSRNCIGFRYAAALPPYVCAELTSAAGSRSSSARCRLAGEKGTDHGGVQVQSVPGNDRTRFRGLIRTAHAGRRGAHQVRAFVSVARTALTVYYRLLAKPYVKGDAHAQLPLLVSRYEE
jgi:hypothetical protein